MEIRGAVALVTGASSGIGEATAAALGAAGARVVASARRVERLEELVGRVTAAGGVAEARPVDVSDKTGCEALVAGIEQDHGRLDIIVNNAGIPMRRHGSQLRADHVERVMTVNYFGAVWITLAALPGMLERRHGTVCNVTSVAGHLPNPSESAYAASKAALSQWTHTMAVDLADSGVHFCENAPGPIETDIWERDDNDKPIFEGRLYPASMVADDIVGMIAKDRLHRTSPRRFGLVTSIYPLARPGFAKALAAFGRRARPPRDRSQS